MKIKRIELSEDVWEKHQEDFNDLLPVMANLFHHFGGFEPIDDGSEWTPEKAAARLLRPGVLTPVARKVVRAWQCVLRSLGAASSERERLLTQLISLSIRLRKVNATSKDYQKMRPEEVREETAMDEQIGWGTVHCAEQERAVADAFHSWRVAMKAAYLATNKLCMTLRRERPLSLEAGIYSGKGSGPFGEFGLRMVAQGIHPRHAALIRNDVHISDPTLQSKTQKAELRNKGIALKKEALHAATRIKALIS